MCLCACKFPRFVRIDCCVIFHLKIMLWYGLRGERAFKTVKEDALSFPVNIINTASVGIISRHVNKQ